MELEEAKSAKLDQLKDSGWVIVYPSYFDKTMSVKDGRKVSNMFSCECPGIPDIANACIKLGLECLVENKRYPKTWWVPGRCRVHIHNPDGSPCNININSRKELFIEIGKVIPVIRESAIKLAEAATTKTVKKGKGKKK